MYDELSNLERLGWIEYTLSFGTYVNSNLKLSIELKNIDLVCFIEFISKLLNL